MLISVITVVLNCVNTIEYTIQSVICQKKKDIEYIIVDGGSTDGTLDIIRHYSDKIDHIISEPDEGIYDAMNKGIRIAKGEWISFLNGNDWYEENSFGRVQNEIGNTDKKILYCKVNLIKNGVKDGFVGIDSYVDPENLHYTNLYCHQGLFIKKELFELLGYYNTRYKIYADYEWNLRAHCNGYNPLFIDYTVANFTFGGVSTSQWESMETLSIISKYALTHDSYRREVLENIGRAEYNIIKELNLPYLYPFFERFNKYYIWGMGENGKDILNVMEKMGLKVIGFIDTFAYIREKRGVNVYKPEEILSKLQKKDTGIFIATDRYEDDIVSVIKESNNYVDAYTSFRQMYVWVFNRINGNVKDTKLNRDVK